MIEFIKLWANQIIVAVIIATIIEMILPNGNNKKYIKMVIGIYVLVILIQPIVSKITGKELNISVDYEKYFEEDILEINSYNFENNNSKLIEEAYINNIEKDVQAKVEKKGYNVTSCDIKIVTTEEGYGEIQNISLKIQTKEEENNNNNVVEIEKVEVNINDEEIVEDYNITIKEKQELISYLSEEYSIDITKIIIN